MWKKSFHASDHLVLPLPLGQEACLEIRLTFSATQNAVHPHKMPGPRGRECPALRYPAAPPQHKMPGPRGRGVSRSPLPSGTAANKDARPSRPWSFPLSATQRRRPQQRCPALAAAESPALRYPSGAAANARCPALAAVESPALRYQAAPPPTKMPGPRGRGVLPLSATKRHRRKPRCPALAAVESPALRYQAAPPQTKMPGPRGRGVSRSPLPSGAAATKMPGPRGRGVSRSPLPSGAAANQDARPSRPWSFTLSATQQRTPQRKMPGPRGRGVFTLSATPAAPPPSKMPGPRGRGVSRSPLPSGAAAHKMPGPRGRGVSRSPLPRCRPATQRCPALAAAESPVLRYTRRTSEANQKT